MTIETTGDPTRVRIATVNDVDEVYDLCVCMAQENFVMPMDGPKVRGVLVNATLPDIGRRRGIIGVIGEPGQLEASIGLMLDRTWYSDGLCLFDAWQYVKPEYRSTSGSKDMIAWAKGISDHFQVPLMMGIVSSERTQAKVRLLRRQLGEPVGAFFMYQKTAGAC
jgi:hypothetical protein